MIPLSIALTITPRGALRCMIETNGERESGGKSAQAVPHHHDEDISGREFESQFSFGLAVTVRFELQSRCRSMTVLSSVGCSPLATCGRTELRVRSEPLDRVKQRNQHSRPFC